MNNERVHIYLLKLFNRLIIIVQRNDTVQHALSYELTVVALSLFDNNLFMQKANKAVLGKFLKSLTVASTRPEIAHRVLDGGWLLHQVKWIEGDTWLEIADRYVTFIINWSLVNNVLATQLSLFLDGYESSTKDHEHLRRTKHLCGTVTIAEDMVHFVTKEKFCDNPKNKAQLVPLIAKRAKERLPEINVMQCRDDADTGIVKGALDASRYGPVKVRTEDTDNLVILVKHVSSQALPVFVTTSTGTYHVQEIQRSLTHTQREYITVCHAFTGCDTVSSIFGHGKYTVFKKLCETPTMYKHLDVFNSPTSTNDEIINAGGAIFQFIYNAPDVDLSQTRYDLFCKKAAAGVISPDGLPLTRGSAAQHSLRAYSQNQDWLQLKSMSKYPKQYGYSIDEQGYKPLTTLDDWAPLEIRKLTCCDCKGLCNNKRCTCFKSGVTCISACGTCKGVTCMNAQK